MEEKKEIKMSLWTFFVLVAGIVALIGAVIIGGFYVWNNASTPLLGEMENDDKIIQDAIGSTSQSSTTSNKTMETNTIIVNSAEDGKIMVATKDPVTGEVVTNVLEGNSIASGTNTINSSTTTLNTVLPNQVVVQNKIEPREYIMYVNGTDNKLDSNDLNYNTVLTSRIDETKSVNNVSNYASDMTWHVYDNLDYSLKYPADWNVEYPTNGIEQIKISGKAIGKQVVAGLNGDKVVEAEMMIIAYNPVICTMDEIMNMGLTNIVTAISNYNIEWTQVYLEGNNVATMDNYAITSNGDGTYKLIRVRVLSPKDEPQTFKSLNIENYVVGEIKIK